MTMLMTRVVLGIVAIWAVSIGEGPAERGSPAEPSLVAINVTFELPKCDNRDHDTGIRMLVVKDKTVIAQEDNLAPGREFPDPGTYGPFPLPLRNTIPKSAFSSTFTRIHIDPNKHDTWCTKIHVDALFNDNSHLNFNNCSVVKLSEANKDYEFPNRSCGQ